MKDIHITDLQQFTGCRRRWNWQSSLRDSLQKAILPEPLFTGLAVHIGLDAYHSNHDSVYCAVTAAKQWMSKRIDTIGNHTGPMWDDERKMINDSYRLSLSMLKHYAQWHDENKLSEKWEVIATEQLFTVPIPVPSDIHYDGDYYSTKLHAYVSSKMQLAGRFDGLIKERSTGDVYLLEFKTARSIANIRWVMRGLQGTAYVYAAQQLHPNVKGILYRVLRKKAPSMPKPLKSGGYSQSKSQDTSFRYFKRYLDMEARDTGRDPTELYRENEKVLRMLHAKPENFFLERRIKKAKPLIKSTIETIYRVGIQMTDPNTPIFANPGWSTCAGCPFQDPCDLLELGMDEEAKDVLAAEYAPRRYWDEQ